MSDEDEGDDQAAQGFMRGWNSGLNYISVSGITP